MRNLSMSSQSVSLFILLYQITMNYKTPFAIILNLSADRQACFRIFLPEGILTETNPEINSELALNLFQ